MSDLESLQAFENDALHYVALIDRAIAQLKRVLGDEEMGLGYSELNGVGSGLHRIGGQITEYVQTKRAQIFRDIDKEAGRTVEEAGEEGHGRLRSNTGAKGFHPSDQPVLTSRK